MVGVIHLLTHCAVPCHSSTVLRHLSTDLHHFLVTLGKYWALYPWAHTYGRVASGMGRVTRQWPSAMASSVSAAEQATGRRLQHRALLLLALFAETFRGKISYSCRDSATPPEESLGPRPLNKLCYSICIASWTEHAQHWGWKVAVILTPKPIALRLP